MHYIPFIFIGVFYPLIMVSQSQLSGWGYLAKKYRNDNSAVDWKPFQSGTFGAVSYKHCLWLSPSAEGLYIKTGPLFFFRPFHPQLLIPWQDVVSIEEKRALPFTTKFAQVKLTDPFVKLSICSGALQESQRFLGDKLTLIEKEKHH